MERGFRGVFGGWERVSGRSGEFRPKELIVPVNPTPTHFVGPQREPLNVVKWLKTKIGQSSGRRTSSK